MGLEGGASSQQHGQEIAGQCGWPRPAADLHFIWQPTRKPAAVPKGKCRHGLALQRRHCLRCAKNKGKRASGFFLLSVSRRANWFSHASWRAYFSSSPSLSAFLSLLGLFSLPGGLRSPPSRAMPMPWAVDSFGGEPAWRFPLGPFATGPCQNVQQPASRFREIGIPPFITSTHEGTRISKVSCFGYSNNRNVR
jgi:hypothetical protein